MSSPGCTLRVEVEGWLDKELSVGEADWIGQRVAAVVAGAVPEMRSFTFTARGV
jgi:hypothetical protein